MRLTSLPAYRPETPEDALRRWERLPWYREDPYAAVAEENVTPPDDDTDAAALDGDGRDRPSSTAEGGLLDWLPWRGEDADDVYDPTETAWTEPDGRVKYRHVVTGAAYVYDPRFGSVERTGGRWPWDEDTFLVEPQYMQRTVYKVEADIELGGMMEEADHHTYHTVFDYYEADHWRVVLHHNDLAGDEVAVDVWHRDAEPPISLDAFPVKRILAGERSVRRKDTWVTLHDPDQLDVPP